MADATQSADGSDAPVFAEPIVDCLLARRKTVQMGHRRECSAARSFATPSRMYKFFAALLIGFSLVGCYRVPGEEDFSAIPATNNPKVTCEKASSKMLPGMSY